MIPMQQTKAVGLIFPAAILDNASATSVEVDTRGWNYASFYVIIGATDIAMAALKLRDNDATGTGQVDIDAFTIANSACLDIAGAATTLPSATDDDTVVVFHVDLKARKRFMDVVATAGDGSAGTYLSGLCILSKGEVSPNTNAEAGGVTVIG